MITCPYCDREYECCVDGFEQDETWEEECPHCEQIFLCTGCYEPSFSESRADCLNGITEHDFQMSHTYPKEFARMGCTVCGRKK